MKVLEEFARAIEMPFLTGFSKIYLSILFVLWVGFSIRALLLKNELPWGFGIVILGITISGYGLSVNNFSINLLFILMLIGVFWDINNIRQLIHVGIARVLLRHIIIGIITGLLLGLFLVLLQGTQYLQINGQYSMGALVAISIQISVAEEFLFRGFLLGYLKKFGFNPLLGNAIQAVLFTAIHISRYAGNWLSVLIILLAGLAAGYFTLKNQNLFTAIFLHIVVNLVAVMWWVVLRS